MEPAQDKERGEEVERTEGEGGNEEGEEVEGTEEERRGSGG